MSRKNTNRNVELPDLVNKRQLTSKEREELERFCYTHHGAGLHVLLQEKGYSDREELEFFRLYYEQVVFIDNHQNQPFLVRDRLTGLTLDESKLEILCDGLSRRFPYQIGIQDFVRRLERKQNAQSDTPTNPDRSPLTHEKSGPDNHNANEWRSEGSDLKEKPKRKANKSEGELTLEQSVIFFHYFFKILEIKPNVADAKKIDVISSVTHWSRFSIANIVYDAKGGGIFRKANGDDYTEFEADMHAVKSMFQKLQLQDVVALIEVDIEDVSGVL